MLTRNQFFRASFATLASAALVGWSDDAIADEAVLKVTAKLIEIPAKKFQPDDLYDYAYVMRYEVISGSPEKSILVAHYKPRQSRVKIKDKMKPFVSGKVKSFAVGDVHKLELARDLKKIWKGPLVDDFAATDSKSIRYWCLVADPA